MCVCACVRTGHSTQLNQDLERALIDQLEFVTVSSPVTIYMSVYVCVCIYIYIIYLSVCLSIYLYEVFIAMQCLSPTLADTPLFETQERERILEQLAQQGIGIGGNL